MNRTEIETALTDLNELVTNGRLLEAFEKYYHDEVVMQENELSPTVSKELNRKREIEFKRNLTELRKAEVRGIGTGDDISFVIWKYDYTHKEWGVKNYTQVSVQHWKDGQIIREKFFYNN